MLDYVGDQRTMGYMLQDIARRNYDKVCIYYGDEKVTYGELYEKSNQVGNALLEMGLKKGDRIGVMLPNSTDYVVVQFGITKVGMIEANISTDARGAQLAHFFNNSDPVAVIVDEQFLPLVKSVEHDLAKTPKLIVRSAKARLPKAAFERKFEMVPFSGLLAASKQPPQVEVSNTDPVAIFYTSGTTGLSKGVVLSHNHHWNFPRNIVRSGRLGPDDIMYSCFPYYHAIPQFMCTLAAFLAEGAVAIADRFSASQFWDDIRRYHATTCWSVLSIPSILMKQPPRPDDGDHPLRVFFTIGIDPDVWEPFAKRFKVKLLTVYGSTEQNMITCLPYEGGKIGSAGKALDDFEVVVVDEKDNLLPPGEVGEIVSRPRQPYIQMMRYQNMPEETLKMFRNLWLHGGDRGYLDEDGYLFFAGRAKDTIRRKGENVSAYEVECVITAHPAVEECAVVPVPSDVGEEEIKTVVVFKSGKTAAPEELVAFCRERMSRYMVPRYWQFRARLPKTPTERVEKGKLKAEGVTPDTWDADKR